MWYLLILLVILLKTIICIHKTIAYLCLLPIQNEIDYIKWCEIHVAFNLFLVFNFRFKVTLPSKKLNFVRRLCGCIKWCQIYVAFNSTLLLNWASSAVLNLICYLYILFPLFVTKFTSNLIVCFETIKFNAVLDSRLFMRFLL